MASQSCPSSHHIIESGCKLIGSDSETVEAAIRIATSSCGNAEWLDNAETLIGGSAAFDHAWEYRNRANAKAAQVLAEVIEKALAKIEILSGLTSDAGTKSLPDFHSLNIEEEIRWFENGNGNCGIRTERLVLALIARYKISTQHI